MKITGTREELVGEAADLVFHMLVLLGARDVALAEVCAELARREGLSGLAEKAARVLQETIDTCRPPPGSAGLLIGLGPGVSVELVLLRW